MREINKNLSLRQRVLQICDYYRISPNKLSQDAGYGRNFISRMTDTTSFDFMIHIYRNFEQINIEWLLTGNGKMLLPDVEEKKSSVLIVEMLDKQLEKNLSLEKEVAELREKLTKIKEDARV